MKSNLFSVVRGLVAMTVLSGVLMIDGISITQVGLTISTAHAFRGRPATPLSYAGVARRTTRRAVAVGTTVARPVVVSPVVVTPVCVQRVDAYGRIVTVCK